MPISIILVFQMLVTIIQLAVCSCWADDDVSLTTSACFKQWNTCKMDCFTYFIYWPRCFIECDEVMTCCEELANTSPDEHVGACQGAGF